MRLEYYVCDSYVLQVSWYCTYRHVFSMRKRVGVMLKWCDVCVCCFLLQVIETLAASIEYGLEGLTKVEIILWLYIGKMIVCDSGNDMYKVSLLHPPGFPHSLPSLTPPPFSPPPPSLPFILHFSLLPPPSFPWGELIFRRY